MPKYVIRCMSPCCKGAGFLVHDPADSIQGLLISTSAQDATTFVSRKEAEALLKTISAAFEWEVVPA